MFQPGVDEYAARLSHYTRFELLELPAERSSREEGKRILGKVAASEWLIAMDERGEQLSSVELGQWISQAQRQSKDLVFVIGGDEGLDASVREKANRTLALSRMTLPHRLARLVLVEQLYRAFTLLKGEPYHK